MVTTVDSGTVSKFVGRTSELEELTGYLEEAKAGQGRLVVIEGEAGIGKTRLVNELQNIAKEQGFDVLRGRCLTLQQADPYLPFKEALGHRLRMPSHTDETDILPLGLMGVGSDQTGEEASTLPLGLLPMADAAEAVTKIDIQSERDKLFNNVLDVITDSSRHKPVMLFIDDLQWADNATLQMLFYIARNITDASVLLCSAFRSGEVERGDESPFAQMYEQVSRSVSHKRIVLERMSEPEISEIIKSTLGVKDIPDKFLKKLHDESQGNPFFVEEVVKSLMDEGIILRHGHIWDTGVDIASIRIPNTIRDVITHRIARLDENTRRILRFAAVIGDKYSFDVLKEVTGANDDVLLDALDKLMEADIIHEISGSKEEEFVFDHKVTRGVVYESMSKSRVRLMHKSAGEVIERLHSDNLEPWIFELARHFSMGKDFEKAYNYITLAGDKALRTLAFEEAAVYYISALRNIDFLSETEGLDKDEEKLKLSMSIGRLYLSLGIWNTATKHFETALTFSRKREDEKEESKVLIALGDSQRLSGEYKKAEDNYNKVAPIAEKLGDLEGMANVQRGLGYVHWRRGEHDDAVDHYNQSISFSMKAGDISSMAKTFIELGNTYNHWGDQGKAIEYYEKSLTELEKMEDYSELARAHNNMGDSYLKLKEWDKAIEHFDRCKEAAGKIGHKNMVAWALFNSAEALAYTGELEKAEEQCIDALKICEAQDDKIGMNGIFRCFGVVYRLKKEWNKSIDNTNKSIVILEMLDIPYDLANTYLELGRTYEEMGEKSGAVLNYTLAKDLFESVGSKSEVKKAEQMIKALEG